MKRKHRLKLKASWGEFRARLSMGTKAKLISIIKILWGSASTSAKNKVIKIAAVPSFSGKISRKSKGHRSSKAKGKRKSKRKGKAGSIRFITVKMKGGKTRKQKAKVLSSGKLKFIKN